MAGAIIPILTIAMQAEPELVALVKSIMALRKKYPNITPDQITAIVQQIAGQADTEFDSVLSKISADQASHPAGGPVPVPVPAPPPPPV